MAEEEFERVFEEHCNAVYQFAWRITKSPADAEDIAQEVFVTFLRGEASHDPARGSIRALLIGIARHLTWKRYRGDHHRHKLAPPFRNDGGQPDT